VLDAGEYAAGLGQLEAEVRAGRDDFAYSLEWALLTARRG
jgi:hypothetical protein